MLCAGNAVHGESITVVLGEFSAQFFAKLFVLMDREGQGRLSQARYIKDRSMRPLQPHELCQTVLEEVGAQLQAVCRPNARKSRPTCRKDAKASEPESGTESVAAGPEVWEISDGESDSEAPERIVAVAVDEMMVDKGEANDIPLGDVQSISVHMEAMKLDDPQGQACELVKNGKITGQMEAVVMGDYKYPLTAEPDYFDVVSKKVETLEPPIFSTQGEPAGKKRGRKPNKENKDQTSSHEKSETANKKGKTKAAVKAKAIAQAKSNQSVGRGKGKGKGKSKAASVSTENNKGKANKKKDPEMPAAEGKASNKRKDAEMPAAASSSTEKNKGKASNKRKVPDPEMSAAASSSMEKNKGKRRNVNVEKVPPPHVKTNNVYSSAYRKAKAQRPDDLNWVHAQAKAATKLFIERGVVNDLCGEFREKPNAKRDDN
eukprot:s228_g8.t1